MSIRRTFVENVWQKFACVPKGELDEMRFTTIRRGFVESFWNRHITWIHHLVENIQKIMALDEWKE